MQEFIARSNIMKEIKNSANLLKTLRYQCFNKRVLWSWKKISCKIYQ